MKMKDAVSKKEKRVKTQLNFANLLKEEQLFLDKLIQMESFNFEEDFMFKDKRVRDSKVIQWYYWFSVTGSRVKISAQNMSSCKWSTEVCQEKKRILVRNTRHQEWGFE